MLENIHQVPNKLGVSLVENGEYREILIRRGFQIIGGGGKLKNPPLKIKYKVMLYI